ncbi:uncharacterized protein OCT59_002122 [Rhizophagus irregularis]|uniref:uncharacterized protein n=1 Tax=Rhizophagus irregularis TaxID=588596 RepID=UPI00331CC5B0|nr:hypothetical protein OCT59_002122 [Rhizophagus irregularis]
MYVITCKFGKSGNAIIDDFIFEKRLKWIPYNKFKNVEYLDKGGFGTVYKAIWSNNNGDREVILKCHNDLNDNSLNEFLNEWKYHESCLNSSEIINFYGFTKDPDTLRYMVAMDCANMDLMKKCWNEVPLNRPSSEEVLDIIEKWIFLPYGKKIEDINEELKCNVLEFINAPIGHNKLATKSHPKASYTSLLSNFTNKELNKIPESEDSQAYHSNLTKLLDVNNSAKLNEILESEMSMNNCNLNDYFYMD